MFLHVFVYSQNSETNDNKSNDFSVFKQFQGPQSFALTLHLPENATVKLGDF